MGCCQPTPQLCANAAELWQNCPDCLSQCFTLEQMCVLVDSDIPFLLLLLLCSSWKHLSSQGFCWKFLPHALLSHILPHSHFASTVKRQFPKGEFTFVVAKLFISLVPNTLQFPAETTAGFNLWGVSGGLCPASAGDRARNLIGGLFAFLFKVL